MLTVICFHITDIFSYVCFPSLWSWFYKSNCCKARCSIYLFQSLCHRCTCNGMFFSHLYTTSCSSFLAILTCTHRCSRILVCTFVVWFWFSTLCAEIFLLCQVVLVTIKGQVKATNENVWRRIEKRNLAEFF